MATDPAIKLPGFGLPLDQMPTYRRDGEKKRFPHAISDFFATEGITCREVRIIDFINQITDKPRWTEKINDEKVVAKWRTEACGTKEQQETSDQHLSEQCFDYCMQELQDKAEYLRIRGVVHVLDVEATVIKADLDNENEDFSASLSEVVKPLESIPDTQKDWHPGSDGLVLDLVHPSLFPLHYGKSKVLPRGNVGLLDCSHYIGSGLLCPVPDAVKNESSMKRPKGCTDGTLKPWGSYQWLPSDIQFREDGTATIESYINNLHPQQHNELYRVLEKAVDRALPLWNECLSWFHTRLRIKVDGASFDDFKPPPIEPGQWNEDEEGDEDDEEDEVRDWLRGNPDQRQINQPDPTENFKPFEDRIREQGYQRLNLRKDFSDGLQIIFKLANIHLSPDQPQYSGSDWHVEGALNEHICATALFYYDQENIEDSYLEFRHEVDSMAMIMKPEQNEPEPVEDLFGVAEGEAAVQDLGKVLTRTGRILAFPNVMQHRVRPFGLADPSKRGHRKILAMFLVDPHIRILSTSNVPPQRRDWWAEEVRKVEPFSGLPVELFDRIVEDVEDFPIGWEEACAVREALMAERGRARDEFDEMLEEDTFGFCEH